MKINKSYIKQLVKEELEAVINEGSYEDMISDMEKDMEDHMARKSMDKMSDPSPAPAHLRTPRTKPNLSSEEIEDTMTSLAKQLQAQGFGVSLKINGEKKV